MSTRRAVYVPPPAPTPPVPDAARVLDAPPPQVAPREDLFWPAAWLLWGGWLGAGGLIVLATDTAPDWRWVLGWAITGLCGMLGVGGLRGLLLDVAARQATATHAAQSARAAGAIVGAYTDYYAAQAAALTQHTAHVLSGSAARPAADPPPVISRPPPPSAPLDDEDRKAIAHLTAQLAQTFAYLHPTPTAPDAQETQPLAADGPDLLAAAYYNGPTYKLVELAHAGQSIACAAVTPRLMSDRAWRKAAAVLCMAGVLIGGGERRPYRLTPGLRTLAPDAAHEGALGMLRSHGTASGDLPGDLQA